MILTIHPLSTSHLYCQFFGHNFEISKHVTYYVKEYSCLHCSKQLTTNSNGNLVELTPKFQEINNVLEDIYNKKKLRLKNKYNSLSIC